MQDATKQKKQKALNGVPFFIGLIVSSTEAFAYFYKATSTVVFAFFNCIGKCLINKCIYVAGFF